MVLDIQTHTLSLLRQQRIAEAEEQLRRIAATSNDGPLHALHAICLAELDHWLEAADAARRAVVIDPQDAYGHWAFALVRLVSQEFRKARVAAAKAVKLNPNDADYLLVLARAEAGQQNWDEALAALESGLRINPDHDGCRQLRDAIHKLRGGRPEASDDFVFSLSHNPPDAVARAARIWAGIEAKTPAGEGGKQVGTAPQAHAPSKRGRKRRNAPGRARSHLVLGGVVLTVSLGVTALLTGETSVGLGAMICGFVLLPLVGLFGVNRAGRAQQS
jgi:tetratricopeptide (TPR) repeat protein